MILRTFFSDLPVQVIDEFVNTFLIPQLSTYHKHKTFHLIPELFHLIPEVFAIDDARPEDEDVENMLGTIESFGRNMNLKDETNPYR